MQKAPTPKIDEAVLDQCIKLLEQCDPTGETPDDPELAYFEQMSIAQIPLIDQKLAEIDRQHILLAQVDVAIRDVLASYDNAVQQARNSIGQPHPNYAQQQAGYIQQPVQFMPPQNVEVVPPQQFQPVNIPPQNQFPQQ